VLWYGIGVLLSIAGRSEDGPLQVKSFVVNIIFRLLIFLGLLLGILFGVAGRWDLPFFWAYLGVVGAFALTFRLVVDPGLQQERIGAGSGKRALGFRLLLLPFVLAHVVLACLDAGRFRWSNMPLAVQVAGLVGMVLGLGLVMWSMAVNRFFSPAVRIQHERGHYVIRGGPYRWLRHPGYLGMIVAAACSGPALGSWWSMLPVAGYVLVILCRTAAEDRFLRAELAAYGKYAEDVHYRLVPGVW
jgi:protein-S-isoprenylcysteine O-methyltransferase Ste14